MSKFVVGTSKPLLRNICSPRVVWKRTFNINLFPSDLRCIDHPERFSIQTNQRHFSDGNVTSAHRVEKDTEALNKMDGDESNEDGTPEIQYTSEDKLKIQELENEIKEIKDQLLRALAEQENIRRIAKRDVDNARSFAVSSFAKSLLDTSDNLTRAMDAVPEAYRSDKENHPVLATLFEGIQMIDDGLTKAFNKNGLKKYAFVGEKFDPNLHEALFEYPDPNMESGSIGQVMKPGFLLNNRVLRPAEVGVIKK